MKTILPLAFSLVLVPSALVAQSLEFDDVTLFGGTISYGGASGVDPLVGTDIIFDVVTGVGTTPAGPLEIVGGKLNFTTGPNILETPAFYTFGAGGSFTLTGTVIKPDLSVVATGVLLAGSFTDVSLLVGLGSGNGLFAGIGVDEKNPGLLDYYGLVASTFRFANTEIAFSAAGVDPITGAFTASVSDSDLVNTPIPEAGTLPAVLAVGALVLWRLRVSYRRQH